MSRIVLFTVLFFTCITYGQRKYFADRFFDEYAYTKSAELYENIYNNGDNSSYILSRLGDSYYNNSDYIQAEKWYKELLENYEEEVSSEYMFKYSQTLKSNGKINASDTWMLKFKDVAELDSRPKALVDNRDYFIDYTNKKTTFINVHNISTNTEYSDFGGFIYNDELYFASTKPDSLGLVKKNKRLYKWNNQPFLNIYKAGQKPIDEFEMLDVKTDEIFNVVNSKYHESNIVFTKDGNTLYFTRDNYDGRKVRRDQNNSINLKLYRVDKDENGKWGDVVELPFNNDDYSVGHPTLSADEQTLYFVSDMPGGKGKTDIYKVSVENHENYGEPINLGEPINTEGKEMFPYVGSNETLYFSSNGHLGLGALDVFESKMVGEGFSEPVNLATPINSAMDDFAFVINDDLTNGYFSSNREGGKGDDDIYSFIFGEKEEPKKEPEIVEPETCTQRLAGIVRAKHDNSPIAGATITLFNASGEKMEEKLSNEDGSYSFDLLTCDIANYTLKGDKLNYKPDSKSFKTKQVTDKHNVTKIDLDLSLTALIQGDQIVINPIYFDFDRAFIREDAKYELEDIVTVMRNNPGMIIKIESHTDSRGSRAYNRSLSDRRAKSTREYIHSRGIERSRIQSAIGYGEDRLLNHCDDANKYNCSEEEHQLNRRSYFYIVSNTPNVKVQGQQGN